METLKDLMVENGDDKSRIFYLKVIIKAGFSDVCRKVDIEGHELDALPQWIESGVLEKVFSRSLLLYCF